MFYPECRQSDILELWLQDVPEKNAQKFNAP